MFTQRDEEKYILQFFENSKGKFLDIGAFDGKCFSTTHALALKGWGGVCVEPSPSVFPALNKLYKENNKIVTMQYAITDKTGLVDFYDSGGDMISTVSTEHVKLWSDKEECKFTKLELPSLSVLDLFERVGYDFDFISLDVEGTNIEILNQFPFEKLGTKMLCIEFDHKEQEVLQLVEPFGFTLLHKTCENLLLTRDSI